MNREEVTQRRRTISISADLARRIERVAMQEKRPFSDAVTTFVSEALRSRRPRVFKSMRAGSQWAAGFSPASIETRGANRWSRLAPLWSTLRSVDEVVSVDPQVMSGTPVFRDTRVPIQTLLDHLEAGDSLEVFLANFPTVSREQAVRFLELAGDAVVAALDADSA